MINTTHITTGAAVGLAIGGLVSEPLVAVPLSIVAGIVSHHILDLIPHTDAGSFRDKSKMSDPLSHNELLFALFDNIIGTSVILALFFAKEPSWAMLFGAAGGNFPDVFHHPNQWSAITRDYFKGKYYHFHETYHTTARGSLIPLGVATNATLIIGSLCYIWTFH